MFYLAKMYGMEVPDLELTPDEQHDQDTYRAYAIASNLIVKSPRSALVSAKINEYGWTKKTLEDLGIGGVSGYDWFLTQMTKTYGFDRQFLRNVDLDNKLMFNSECLIFTVCDEHGSPVGFAARSLLYDSLKKDVDRAIEEYGADSEQAKEAKAKVPKKFINSSAAGKDQSVETELKNRIYRKGTRLFGFHQAKKNAPPLYIFEGYADCATAYNVGLCNCCAIGATSFTEEHYNMILDVGINHVICNLDADEAGEKGVDKFVKIVKDDPQVGLKIEILELPKGMDDPDNFIRQRGLAAFMDVKPVDIFGWELKRSIAAGENPDLAFERIMPTIVAEKNNLLRLRMAEALSMTTGIPSEVVWAEVQQRVDAEGRKIHTELGMVASRTAKMLERNPDKLQEILMESTRAVERINTMKQGYDLNNLVSYLDEIMNQAEEKKTDDELKTGWPLFDSAFGGIPCSDAFISIPGKPNQGKALAMTAKLKTPIGWKLMRDVQVGDGLASIDGAPSVVTGVFPQGSEKTYRVTFSDGRSVVCSGDHLWSVHFVHQYSEGYGDDKHNGWKVFTTDAIRQFCLNGNRKNSHREVFVPLVSGDFGSSESLPLDPWLLGALLGDGGLTEGSPTITKADPYIIDKVRGKVGDLGLDVVLADDKDTFRICHAGRYGLQNPLMETLRLLGLWETDSFTKFIPRQYLDADVESRWQLLQGLMDTDGTAGKTKETSYGTSSTVGVHQAL
jgi:DNA primase